jgi:hypothetical protein
MLGRSRRTRAGQERAAAREFDSMPSFAMHPSSAGRAFFRAAAGARHRRTRIAA